MAKMVGTTKSLVLISAAVDFLNAKNWTTGSWAKDKNGKDLNGTTNWQNVKDPKACMFCAEGAVMKCAADLGFTKKDAETAIKNFNRITGTSMQMQNDILLTVREVRDFLRRGLAKMKKVAKVGAAC